MARGKTRRPSSVDAEGVQPRHLRLAAHLHHLHLAHGGVAVQRLPQPQDAVGHREDGRGLGLGLQVLAHQEGGGLPAGHLHAQLLHEVLELRGALLFPPRRAHHRAERVDEDVAGRVLRHLFGDARHQALEVALQQVRRQVDVADRLVELRHVEEAELLLVPQHLQRRLSQHGEEQRARVGLRQREHHLVGQRRLAAAGRAGDEVERELGDAAAQQLVEAGHAGRQASNRDFVIHGSTPW